jgi:RNA polymerase sigma-70 factor (sigma-E family)
MLVSRIPACRQSRPRSALHHLPRSSVYACSCQPAGGHAAEDLVQESLVKLYRAWPKLQGDGAPDAYLRRIMVNTHRSWWRARWRRETPVGELPETVIADFADGRALAAQVRQALQALPQRQRAVLVLRYRADLPEAEVADQLGCSLGTVKTHAHRGLRALRDNLGEDRYERHGN